MSANRIFELFYRSIEQYHILDSINQELVLPTDLKGIDIEFYSKNWIDCIQWHCEDLIRNPTLIPTEAIDLKKKIDQLNQQRTEKVEQIDDCLWNQLNPSISDSPILNTETPAWAIDRLSILALKIYHMDIEAHRKDISSRYLDNCSDKLNSLILQKNELIHSIDCLFQNVINKTVSYKLYRQHKMYNDEEMNPVLRSNKFIS